MWDIAGVYHYRLTFAVGLWLIFGMFCSFIDEPACLRCSAGHVRDAGQFQPIE